jgi:hypothetical protein
VSPKNILNSDTTIFKSYPYELSLSSDGALFIYDFGQEVGGIVTLSYTATGKGPLGLAFSESKSWTGPASDGSNGTYYPGGDGALFTKITETTNGSYTMPDSQMRGGFRYLSVFTSTKSSINVTITAVTLEISFQPTWSDLRAYGGYFYCNDDLINRIWYAGAYTLQTNAIPPHTGRVYPLLQSGWKNDAWLGTTGASIFTDGSKRDRATWAGDLAIALPSVFVSTGDFESARNALQLQYDLQVCASTILYAPDIDLYQRSDGELPMAGPPLNFYGSDTYHLSSLIGTHEYILYSADVEFLTSNWTKIKLATDFTVRKLDHTGLLHVTGASDWGRYNQGGRNTAANALMYRSLIAGSIMAGWANDTSSSAAKWTRQAEALKTAINTTALNWDPSVG